MFYVYILESIYYRGWYFGFTSQPLKQRVLQHRREEVISTRHRSAFRMMYFEGYHNELDARGREKFLKSGNGRELIKKQLRHYLMVN
jgi:putative endonuclease